MPGPDNSLVDNVATDINPSGIYSYGYDYNGTFLGDQVIPAYQGADPTQAGQSIKVDMEGTPLLEFSGNEVYGATQDGVTLWCLGTDGYNQLGPRGTVQNFYVWNQNQWGCFGYPANDLTIDGFFDRGDLNINDTSALGMQFARLHAVRPGH